MYFAMPECAYEELIQEKCAICSLDWVDGVGRNALALIGDKKAYTGICWTEERNDQLHKHLVDQIFFRKAKVYYVQVL